MNYTEDSFAKGVIFLESFSYFSMKACVVGRPIHQKRLDKRVLWVLIRSASSRRF